MATDVQSILVNLSKSYPAVKRLIFSISFFTGLAMTLSALYKLKVYGEMRTMMGTQTNLKEPLATFLAAAVFLFIPSAFDSLMVTTFGSPDVTPLSYVASEAPGFEDGMKAVLGLVQIIGLISFIRGWSQLAGAAQQGRQPGGFGKGLTHIFGGLLAMNIAGTKDIIWNTFGFSI